MTISFKDRVLQGRAPTQEMQETIIGNMHYDIKKLYGYAPSDEGIKNLTAKQAKEIAEIVKDASMDFYCYHNANFAFRYILNVQQGTKYQKGNRIYFKWTDAPLHS